MAIYRAKPDDQQKSHIYSPSGPPLDDEVAARLGHNSLLTIFGTSAAFAQDRPDGVPAPTESLADYVLDEATSTLFQGLKSSVEKGYARQMAESWDGWMGAQLSDVSLRYWQSDVTYRGPDATIVDGYRGIYQRLAEVVNHDSTNNGSTIRLNEEIVAIRLSEDGDAITVETRDVEHKEHNPAHNGETSGQTRTYTAPYCVCTLPLGVLQQRPPRFQPPLPKRRLDATRRLGMGLLNKIIVTYPSCFWPEKESFLSFLPSKASTEFLPILASRALFAQNYLPITGKNTLVFYCGAAFGSELEKKTDEEVAQGIHKILAFHFNKDGIDGGSKKVSATSTPATRLPDKPDSIIVTRWESDPYSCGSYSFVRPSRKHDTDLPTPYDFAELARPVWGDRLFFAGEVSGDSGRCSSRL